MYYKEMIKGFHHMGIKVPTDMWHPEEQYFSTSKGEYIMVENMDIFHIVRSFCKLIRNDPDESTKKSLSSLREQIEDLERKISC